MSKPLAIPLSVMAAVALYMALTGQTDNPMTSCGADCAEAAR